jgi:cyclopropane fatty-acyl-phospholipid synthase-like methyltransferase
MPKNVPSPVDLQTPDDAREWERNALTVRPWRTQFFERFASEISAHERPVTRVLELGSGPGFLAEHLLNRMPELSYVALDISAAMHELARARLACHVDRVELIERSFKADGWTDGLGAFDCVVTNQAVHELRHKSYAAALHADVSGVLVDGGLYLMCDHFVSQGAMSNNKLYMTKEEHRAALHGCGFSALEIIKSFDTLVLYRAIKGTG